MQAAVLLGVLILGFLVVTPLRSRASYLFLIALVSLIVPRTIWNPDGMPERVGVGIGSGALSISSYDILLILIAAWAVLRLRGAAWLPWIVPGLLALLFGASVVWPQTSAMLDGVLVYGICFVAWIIGTAVGVDLSARTTARIITGGILAFFLIEVAIAAWQLLSGSASSSRASGTFEHPAFIGKYVLVVLAILLPLTRHSDRTTVRISTLSILFGVVLTAMTLSRANLIAVLGAVALWIVYTMTAHRERKRGFLIGIGAVLLALPFANLVLTRFETDAVGGDRPALFDAGIAVIRQLFWTGTGPNLFVEHASSVSETVARTGYPIHNSFLLAVAELGAIGATLFFLPAIRTLFIAVKSPDRTADGKRGPVSASTIIVMLSIAFAANTGWGFLQAPVSSLVFLALGFSHGMLIAPLYEPISPSIAPLPDRRRHAPPTRRK